MLNTPENKEKKPYLFINRLFAVAVLTLTFNTISFINKDSKSASAQEEVNIIGGRKATQQEIESLLHTVFSDWGSYCSSVLFDDTKAFIARHCISDPDDYFNPSTITIFPAGQTQTTPLRVVEIEDIEKAKDISILTLERAPDGLGSTIIPSALPTTDIAIGDSIQVIGYGQDIHNQRPDFANAADLEVTHYQRSNVCEMTEPISYPEARFISLVDPGLLDDNASNEKGARVSGGDSGGKTERTKDSTTELVGIITSLCVRHEQPDITIAESILPHLSVIQEEMADTKLNAPVPETEVAVYMGDNQLQTKSYSILENEVKKTLSEQLSFQTTQDALEVASFSLQDIRVTSRNKLTCIDATIETPQAFPFTIKTPTEVLGSIVITNDCQNDPTFTPFKQRGNQFDLHFTIGKIFQGGSLSVPFKREINVMILNPLLIDIAAINQEKTLIYQDPTIDNKIFAHREDDTIYLTAQVTDRPLFLNYTLVNTKNALQTTHSRHSFRWTLQELITEGDNIEKDFSINLFPQPIYLPTLRKQDLYNQFIPTVIK